MDYDVILSNDYLEHHGIKGQKWGVRRYQNSDRTWTEAGKKRYGSASERVKATVSNAKHKVEKTVAKMNPALKTAGTVVISGVAITVGATAAGAVLGLTGSTVVSKIAQAAVTTTGSKVAAGYGAMLDKISVAAMSR